MKTLTLYTQTHTTLLTAYVAERQRERGTKTEQGAFGDGWYARYVHMAKDTAALLGLLEDVSINGHSIYGRSPKLAALARERAFSREGSLKALSLYLRSHNALILEGYSMFRMADYRCKLDMMMYGIIKKMKLTEV
jgi:hypothetical protein